MPLDHDFPLSAAEHLQPICNKYPRRLLAGSYRTWRPMIQASIKIFEAAHWSPWASCGAR
jgi:hypothetical protein